jgi:hypothetical protein
MSERKIAMTREEASTRLRELMHGEKTKWWYAFAMGGGCTIENGDDEIMQAIRDEDAMLRSIIKGDR